MCSAVIALELSLRLTLNSQPRELANLILNKYTYMADGIYYYDPRWDIRIMKPNFGQPEMYYNGFWWHHKSNNIGIRAEEDIARADIVVLGDSLVYGHGVESDRTLTHYLEECSGLTVANLGVQADYPPSQYVRLKHLGLFLRPKTVLFFINGAQDEMDFSIYCPTMDYIDRIISEIAPDYSKGISNSHYLDYYNKRRSWRNPLEELILYRIFYKGERLIEGLYKMAMGSVTKDKYGNNDIMASILLHARRLCDFNGSRLIVVISAAGPKESSLNAFCKRFCASNKIPLLDLNDASPAERYFLKGDGHYSPEGNRWVADSIWAYLKIANS